MAAAATKRKAPAGGGADGGGAAKRRVAAQEIDLTGDDDDDAPPPPPRAAKKAAPPPPPPPPPPPAAPAPVRAPAPVALRSAPAPPPPAPAAPAPATPAGSPIPPGTYKASETYLAATPKSIKRLATEFQRLVAAKEYAVSLVDNDLFLWEIRIPFDNSTTLGRDLATYYPPKDQCVLIRMAYDATHPFKAPFVRVRSPRFLKGSSNVMEGGAICIDTFSAAGWSPAMTAEKSILAIQSLLQTTGLNARLDPVNHRNEYTEAEGKQSYAYILQAHKDWETQSAASPAPPPVPIAMLPPAHAAPAPKRPPAAGGRSKYK